MILEFFFIERHRNMPLEKCPIFGGHGSHGDGHGDGHGYGHSDGHGKGHDSTEEGPKGNHTSVAFKYPASFAKQSKNQNPSL